MSQRASGFDRIANDQYMTPPWAVELLLGVERIFGHVWEPACGEGAIVETLRKNCPCNVEASDIDPKHDPSGQSIDFLSPFSGFMIPERWPWTIITNPPYGKGGRVARAFVEHALEISQIPDGKVIMLLPVDWDAAKGRQHLFEDFNGYVAKYTLLDRIRWTNLPQSESGPSQNHAWFVWDHARRGRDMRWLRRPKEKKAAA